MANLFLNLPVPSSNAPGSAVDTLGMGATKTIIVGGTFDAAVTIEYACDDAALIWAPIKTFLKPGRITLDLAAHHMRAVTSVYKGGAANADVGSSDGGTICVDLGPASLDISALPALKTAVAAGKCVVEVSEDGVSWSQAFAFENQGGQTARLVGRFARVVGGAAASICGANDGAAEGLLVQDEGVPLGLFTTMNFVGTGVTATDGGGGTAIVTVPGNPMSPPEQWVIPGFAGEGESSGPMVPQVSTNFTDGIRMIRAGSIVGARARLVDPITAGTVTARPTINGAAVGPIASIVGVPAGESTGAATAAPGAVPYAAGDLIGMEFSNTAGVLPGGGQTMEAWLEVYETVP